MDMTDKTNFIQQVQVIERELRARWDSVHEGWQDSVTEGFSNGTMDSYMQNFSKYLDGYESCYGLKYLINQMEKHLGDMEELCKCDFLS